MNALAIKVNDRSKLLRFGETVTTGSRYAVSVDGGAATCGHDAALIVSTPEGLQVAVATLEDGEGTLDLGCDAALKMERKFPQGAVICLNAVLRCFDDGEEQNVGVGQLQAVCAWQGRENPDTGTVVYYKGRDGADAPRIVSCVKTGEDADGNWVYRMVLEDGSDFSFTAPKGPAGANGLTTFVREEGEEKYHLLRARRQGDGWVLLVDGERQTFERTFDQATADANGAALRAEAARDTAAAAQGAAETAQGGAVAAQGAAETARDAAVAAQGAAEAARDVAVAAKEAAMEDWAELKEDIQRTGAGEIENVRRTSASGQETISSEKVAAVDAVGAAQVAAVAAVETALGEASPKSGALGAVETAKENAVAGVNQAKQSAIEELMSQNYVVHTEGDETIYGTKEFAGQAVFTAGLLAKGVACRFGREELFTERPDVAGSPVAVTETGLVPSQPYAVLFFVSSQRGNDETLNVYIGHPETAGGTTISTNYSIGKVWKYRHAVALRVIEADEGGSISFSLAQQKSTSNTPVVVHYMVIPLFDVPVQEPDEEEE